MTSQTAITEIGKFAKPRVSAYPVASFGMFFDDAAKTPTSVLEAGQYLPVTTGRMGLALALEHMGIGQGDKVLIPAYHCNSMVEPVVNARAEPVFYRVDANAKVDLKDVETRIDPDTRVLLVTHYFGFPQNLTDIRAFCDRHGLMLVEDCAHVFFGEHGGQPLGSWGDYAFASPIKFFPMYDGGLLISARHDISNLRLDSAGVVFDVKALFTILERGLDAGRFGVGRPLLYLPVLLKNAVLGLARLLRGRPVQSDESAAIETGQGGRKPRYDFSGYFSGHEGEFDPDWIHTRMSRMSRLILKTASRSRVAERRRQNYRRFHEEVSSLAGCRALYPELPDGVVPYVYPLIVENPEETFLALKQRGVPIARFGQFLWREFDPSICPVTREFSRKVFQFPCYQELRSDELDWIIKTVRETIGK